MLQVGYLVGRTVENPSVQLQLLWADVQVCVDLKLLPVARLLLTPSVKYCCVGMENVIIAAE